MINNILSQLSSIFENFKLFQHLLDIHFSFKDAAVISGCLKIKVVIHLNLVFQHVFNILNIFDYSNSNVQNTVLLRCLFYCQPYQVLYCFEFLCVEFSYFFKVFLVNQLNNSDWQRSIELVRVIVIQDIYLMSK